MKNLPMNEVEELRSWKFLNIMILRRKMNIRVYNREAPCPIVSFKHLLIGKKMQK